MVRSIATCTRVAQTIRNREAAARTTQFCWTTGSANMVNAVEVTRRWQKLPTCSTAESGCQIQHLSRRYQDNAPKNYGNAPSKNSKPWAQSSFAADGKIQTGQNGQKLWQSPLRPLRSQTLARVRHVRIQLQRELVRPAEARRSCLLLVILFLSVRNCMQLSAVSKELLRHRRPFLRVVRHHHSLLEEGRP